MKFKENNYDRLIISAQKHSNIWIMKDAQIQHSNAKCLNSALSRVPPDQMLFSCLLDIFW